MFSPADPFVVLLKQETLCVALWGKIGVKPTQRSSFSFSIHAHGCAQYMRHI